MANNQANIKAVITAEDKASATLNKFGDNVNGVGTSIIAKGVLMADAIEAAAKKVVQFGVDSVKAFTESEDLIAQTNAVLKSTGGVAGVTADQVSKLATAWQKQTKFSDEAVRGAENILLTFTKISADKFPDATEAVLNMSTALGQDLKSSAIQVGKALQDPILGVTALRRVGVNFNDAQRDVIKNLVDTGREAEAQALILKELQTEFGGSAVAAGSTFAGSLEKLKNRFNDLQEAIGQRIVLALQAFAAKLPEIQAFLDTAFGPAVQRLGESLNRLGDAFERLNREHPTLAKGLLTLGGLIAGYLIKALEALIYIQTALINLWAGFINVINGVANAFRSMGNVAAGVASSLVAPFKAAFNAIAKAWNDTVGKLSFKAPSWVPQWGGRGWEVPDIPMLAQGGVVTKPTLAMVGEAGPEAVVPLNKAGGMMGNINITVQAGAFLGTDVEARKFANIILGHLKDAAGSKNMSVAQMIGS